MATTSLWHIKGRLKDLIAYVENPDKTVAKENDLQDFYNVFSYVSRPEATEQGEYVSAINCLKEIALQQMILTKKQYGKDDGYIAWHGYQSFKPDEVTPQEAHAIGLQTAKEMWGDRFQIIVTTHLDKDHLHNHFCFNSVSYIDGGKYNYSNTERKRLRDVSDRICAEHGLSVICKSRKAPSRPIWLDEKSGKPTRYNVYREDVREAANYSRTPYYMEDYLRRKGYITDFTGKHWKIRLPQYEHFTRLDTLENSDDISSNIINSTCNRIQISLNANSSSIGCSAVYIDMSEVVSETVTGAAFSYSDALAGCKLDNENGLLGCEVKYFGEIVMGYRIPCYVFYVEDDDETKSNKWDKENTIRELVVPMYDISLLKNTVETR